MCNKKSFPDEFINALKQEDCVKAKSMIKNESLQNFVDADGTSALHLSARFNNYPVTRYLIHQGCDLEIKDSSGATPLLSAVLHGSFRGGKYLIYEGARRLSGLAPWNSVRHAKAIQDLVASLASQLRDSIGFNSERIGDTLAKMHCSLSAILNLHDPIITEIYLSSEVDTYVFVNEDIMLYEHVMPTLDVPYIRTMLQGSRWAKQWTRQFCRYVINHALNYQKTKGGRDFLKRVFSWEFFSEDTLVHLERPLREATATNIKIFLQYGFHASIKAKYGLDLLACLFRNEDPKVMSSLRKETIDVNGRGYRGNSPLHYAIGERIPRNIRFLLKNGADLNAFNQLHETPLTIAIRDIDSESLKQLLIGNPDHSFACDQFNSNPPFDDTLDNSWCQDYIELAVSQLAIYEALGMSIEASTKVYITNDPTTKAFYEECRRQLKLLEANSIRGNLNDREPHKINFTMFTIVVENPRKIARYVGEEDIQAIATFWKYTRKTLNPHYRQALKKHARDITKINLCRNKAIQVIGECIGINDSKHLVIHKIADYLSYRDLLKFEG